MSYQENHILDYVSGNDCCLGVVVKDNDNRVQVRGATMDLSKIPYRQIIVEHGDAGADARRGLVAVQNAISEAIAGTDTGFIWEIFMETPGEHELKEISDTYFGDTSPVHISALARKLAEDVDHFQRVPGNFTAIRVRSREDSEETIRLRKLRAERTALRERTASWLAVAIGYKGETPLEVPAEMEGFVKGAIDYLLCGTNSEAVNILSRTGDKIGPRNSALRMLKNTARMPEGADEFLLSNGIHAGFSQSVLDYTASLPDEFSPEGRKIITETEVFSIDDEETREIDDAISCRKDGENYAVGIYIADPACYVHKDDELDEVAADRPLSLYLPTTTVTMFPSRLSCDLASLRKNQPRPCLAFQATIAPDGEVLDWELAPSIVTVTRRLTYIEADAMLDYPPTDACGHALADLLRLTDKMRSYREENGAITLNRPELRVRVHNDVVTVEREDQDTPAHRLVAELMVLANHLAAQYALRNELPVIYRVQDPPSGDVQSVHEYEPYFFDQQVRKMKRTRLSTYPQPHFGLGLDLYIQISSPLRRYADLVMHRQIAAHALGQPTPYTQEELFVILDNVDRVASQNRALEREADNYWLLEYLRRECLGKEFGATVLRTDGFILAELDYYCVRGVLMTRDRPMLGERVKATIKDINPAAGRMVLQREY